MTDLTSYLIQQITTTPTLLKHFVESQDKKRFFMRNIFILIRKRINDFLMDQDLENRWIVIPGLRGVGKTTILAQVYFDLTEQKKIPKERVLYLSLDALQQIPGADLLSILRSYEKFIESTFEAVSEKLFLLIDEAHYDKDWSGALKTVYDRSRNIFIITTGSSALDLMAHGADVARRILIEKMFPLSFSEYIMLKNEVKPIRGLSGELRDIIFLSKNTTEVYDGLRVIQSQVLEYWSKFNPIEIENYLTYGSLPFAIESSRDEVFRKTINILNQVTSIDIPKIHPFQPDTLIKISKLLSLLSVSHQINYESICRTVKFDAKTLTSVMETIKNAEIIMPVFNYGSGETKIKKTPRYFFLASSIRASLNWNLGTFNANPNTYGLLLEDTTALILSRLRHYTKHILDISKDNQGSGADFIIRTPSPLGEKNLIPIELGYGEKSGRQVINTMQKLSNSKYGVIFSDKELEIKGDVVFVPKRTLLLM